MFFGDSHLGAIKQARDQTTQTARAEVLGSVEVDFGPVCGIRNYQSEFFTTDGETVRVWAPARKGGSQYRLPAEDGYDWYVLAGPLNASHLYRSIPTWSRYDLPGEHSDRAPMSPALLQRIISDNQYQFCRFIDALLQIELPLVVLDTPPPFRDTRYVREIGPRRLLAVDDAARRRMRDLLDHFQVPIIRVPDTCVEDDGFTRPDYRHPRRDNFHTNVEFGTLMLRRTVEVAGELERDDATIEDSTSRPG